MSGKLRSNPAASVDVDGFDPTRSLYFTNGLVGYRVAEREVMMSAPVVYVRPITIRTWLTVVQTRCHTASKVGLAAALRIQRCEALIPRVTRRATSTMHGNRRNGR